MTDSTTTDFRSPVCCVLGHVDAGKSSTLDRLRGTNYQAREAGGITQSISAWNLQISDVQMFLDNYPSAQKGQQQKIPGLLMIDTPGHEAFMQLRTTGASLCDFAILVVDIHKGIEQQTEESIRILRETKTPFVVAMNKLDSIYGWKTLENGCFRENLKAQKDTVQRRIKDARDQLFLQFANLGMNVELYHQNKDHKTTINAVPISARTGEGIPDLLTVIFRICEKYMTKKIEFHANQFKGLVLKEETIHGYGRCYRTLLVDGILQRGSKICVHGLYESKETVLKQILIYDHRSTHTNGYTPVESVHAACACILVPTGLTSDFDALPGSEINNTMSRPSTATSTAQEISDILGVIGGKSTKWGVWLQSGSIGTLHAMAKFFCTDQKERGNDPVPIIGYDVGPLKKSHIMKMAAMTTELPVIVNFGATVTQSAQEYAKEVGVDILESPIIYRLLDQVRDYQRRRVALLEEKNADERKKAIFPCILKIVPDCIFRAKNPMVLGVEVQEGILKKGVTLCVVQKVQNCIEIGPVSQIKSVTGDTLEDARNGTTVTIEIKDSAKKAGDTFTTDDLLYSQLTRNSIDMLKKHFKSDLTKSDVKAIVEIKKKLDIP